MPKLPESKRRPWQPKKPKQARLNPNSDFYHSKQWRSLRNYYIQRNPLCEACQRRKKTTAGTVVDHIIAINMGGHKTDLSNLQTLCTSCHNSKSGKEGWEYRKKNKKNKKNNL